MDSVSSVWSKLDARKRAIVIAATLAVFVAVLLMARSAGTRDMALLYSGLDPAAAGEVVTALDQAGAVYEIRGSAIYVATPERDSLRMTLAGQGLPASSTTGYELLDGMSGFGTTSQMFDAAYWRAKEGELARTIVSSPHIKAARVHISTPTNRPFSREQRATAAVTVTTASGTLNTAQAKALRYLVASAVSGLSPDDVAVIDDQGGLIAGVDDTPQASANDHGEDLRLRAQRLLEARVGYGNAVVEVSIDTITDSESIVERVINPDSRVAISTEVEERTNTAQDSRGQDVTVASNLPAGDGAGGNGNSSNENNENRAVTNYEVSETTREVVKSPGAVRRLTVAVLVNDVVGVDAAGAPTNLPRAEEELAALRELVASAVGLDETRGDVLTLKSMPFEPLPVLGTELTETGAPLDMMALIKLGVLAVVALVLGLFVVRPILSSGRALALPPPEPRSILDEPFELPLATATPLALGSEIEDVEPVDPVTRLRRLIEERQTETIQILQSWIEDPETTERV